ncbi:MAG: hypothetical protein AAB914_00795 [Patescibacteria group bacterium]
MDFTNQNNKQVPQRPSGLGASPEYEQQPEKPSNRGGKMKKHIDKITAAKIPFLLLTFGIVVLIVALVFKITLSSEDTNAKDVNKSGYQAIFLNNNQVYFGKLTEMNKGSVTLTDIYYIQLDGKQQDTTQAQANSNNITLVKLGCEIHGPQDKMVINNEQVLFWENLKDEGQVVKTIKTNQQKGPQNCDDQTGNNNTNPGTQKTSNTTTPGTTTPSTTTPTAPVPTTPTTTNP